MSGEAQGTDGAAASDAGKAGSAGGDAAAAAENQGGGGGAAAASGAGEGTRGGADAGGARAADAAGKGDGGAAAGAGALWGADWREEWAGGDEKKLKWAQRYASPRDMIEAGWNAQEKIRSGAAKAGLPENPTPEQLASYRSANGIPDKVEGYLEKLPDEVKLDETDREAVAPYLAAMHEMNLSPAQVGKLLAVRNQELETMVEQRAQADETLRVSTEEALRNEWGAEYRANLNSVHEMLNGAPEEVREALLNARLPDGTPATGTVESVRWLAQLARQLNPFGTIVGPGGSALDGKGVEDRLAEINKLMGAPKGSPEYDRYWKDAKVQEEYRTLLAARERNQRRAA